MLAATLPGPDLATPGSACDADPALPAFAHCEAYADYFARLAQHHPPADALRRLLSHVDAVLVATERVALWQAMGHSTRALGDAECRAVAGCLDGRYANLVAALALPWRSPTLVARLMSEALLASGPGTSAQPAAALALLESHGWRPLAQPLDHAPGLVLLAAMAELSQAAKSGTRLGGPMLEDLQTALVTASTRDPALCAPAMGCLFDLALHARDEPTATAVLAELLMHGQAGALPLPRVRDWLDGSFAIDVPMHRQPLALAPRWQARWLQPAAWAQSSTLAALIASLRRDAPRERLRQLAGQLGHDPRAPAAPRPDWQPLTALDAAYACQDLGGDPLPQLEPVLCRDYIAAEARLALHWHAAERHRQQGRLEHAACELLGARRARADDALRGSLVQLLQALGVEAIAALPHFSSDWRDEERFWQQLLLQAEGPLQRIAAVHLATLWGEGSLEPGAPLKTQRLAEAQELWAWLASHDLYTEAVRTALHDPQRQALLEGRCEGPGCDHLWFETAGATRLMVVFSCAVSHHEHPEIDAFRGRLPDHHLLFVRNPDFNWYCDEAFDALCHLVREKVLPRFDPAQVSCHYGSMGGHGALKLALAFGFRALVFNPQTDLDLWATRRPAQRPQLWAVRRHARLDAWPAAAFERMPLYLACGSNSADREALSALIATLRQCRQLSAVVEKYSDPRHAGLMVRISNGSIARTLATIDARLDTLLAPAPLAGMQAVAAGDVAAWWQALDNAQAMKVEIQVRDGRLWWQPSTRCGTVAPAAFRGLPQNGGSDRPPLETR